jgi:HAD superfamily hydrolase (TIGR01549 family)
MSPPKAVPFDVDGTLVDTVELHAQAWVETPQNFGIEADFTDIRLQIGRGGVQFLPGLMPPDRLEQRGEEIQEFRADLFKRKHMSRIKAFPGVRELFQHMKFSGQKTVLASSGQADEEATTNIADLIDGATTSDDAERSKPFPDIFEAAFGKLGLSERTDAMVVGDTPYDAEAPRAAGLSTIRFLCGGFTEQSLRQAGCIAVYRNPQHLLESYEESPLAKGWLAPEVEVGRQGPSSLSAQSRTSPRHAKSGSACPLR